MEYPQKTGWPYESFHAPADIGRYGSIEERSGVVVLLENPLPWQIQGLSFTASGYGKRIPTRYVVRFAGRIRRVYCTIYSNVGTCWFTVNGQQYILGG